MYTQRRREQSTSPSKRWQTTSNSSQADTVALLGTVDRAAITQDLKNRKIQNNKTSISFGQEKVLITPYFDWFLYYLCEGELRERLG